MNIGVYVSLFSMALAQGLKIPIHYLKRRKWRPKLFFETGGMPSSHSAVVSSLTTYIALRKGFSAIDFALSLIFGLIVMYDAQGIRRQTGELTIKVNTLGELVEKISNNEKVKFDGRSPQKLRERLGHQPMEVVGGALFGTFIGIIGYIYSKKVEKSRFFR